MIYIPKDSPFVAQFCERWSTTEAEHNFKLAKPKPDNWRDAAIEASNINTIYMMPAHPDNQWKVDKAISVLEERGYVIEK